MMHERASYQLLGSLLFQYQGRTLGYCADSSVRWWQHSRRGKSREAVRRRLKCDGSYSRGQGPDLHQLSA
jgi:hypothetical protein